MRRTLLVLMLLSGSQALRAEIASLKLKEGVSLSMRLPAGWRAFRDAFGMPLMIVGPEGPEKRPVISFSQTQAEKLSFDDAALAQKQNEYSEGRKAWLAKRGGHLISFIPFKVQKLSSGLELRRIAYTYTLGAKDFEEEMMLASCGTSLVFISSLIPLSLKASRGPEMETLIESLSCR